MIWGIVPNSCYIQRVPKEFLGHVPMTISHVCRQWRTVAVGLPSLWTFLVITTTSYPEIFADFISRSKHRSFELKINLPDLVIEMCPSEHRARFWDTFRTLLKNIVRLRGLHVKSNNSILFILFNRLLKHVELPQLEFLSVHQVDPTARRFTLGPLLLNPSTFTKLSLMNVMIECDASRLAGLRSIALVNSSGTLLDQTQLPHSTYPAIPKEPVMTMVRELLIDTTSLVSTTNDNTPSFDASALRTLVLTRLCAQTEEAAHSVHRLFNFTLGQHLETLTCVSLDTRAFQIFLAMTSAGPTFPHLLYLSLKDVNAGDVTYRFLRAFPAVISFGIEDARPHGVMTYLLARELMPLLNCVHINGRTIPRARTPDRP
ncbi:hypothetical protein DXG01_006258 [Tephrocybe rancida]|nr:hypothetical protein DXG01_006258 [Tephrocybe rancida]